MVGPSPLGLLAVLVVDDGQVEPELADRLGGGFAGLELDDHEPAQLEVEEEEVEVEVALADAQRDLAADEGEPWAELGQQGGHPVGHGVLELTF